MANYKLPFIAKQGITVQGGDARFEGSGYLRLPLGATADRPSTPELGMIRTNLDSGGTEGYFNSQWWDIDYKVKWIIRNANTNIANGYSSYGVALDTTAGPLTVALPPTPKKDDYIVIADALGKFAVNNAFVDPGSLLINGVNQILTLKYKNQSITLAWSGNNAVGWLITANTFDLTQFATESEETAFVFALIL